MRSIRWCLISMRETSAYSLNYLGNRVPTLEEKRELEFPRTSLAAWCNWTDDKHPYCSAIFWPVRLVALAMILELMKDSSSIIMVATIKLKSAAWNLCLLCWSNRFKTSSLPLLMFMWPTEIPKISLEEIPQYSITVYLDNFIGATVKNASGMLLDRISKSALHEIHIIPPLLKSPEIQEESNRYPWRNYRNWMQTGAQRRRS